MANNTENKALSLKEIRDGFYSRRDFEISHLWQRSIFLTAFLVLCFTGYGYLLGKMFDGVHSSQLLNEIACAISLVGIAFSIIWIKMAKGSKAWFEVYEGLISAIEHEDELKIPEKYRMGEFPCKAHTMDSKLFSTEAGNYSVSRLNIIIGIILLIIWLFLIVVHYAFTIWTLIEIANFIHLIPVLLIPIMLIIILLTAKHNRWAKSGALK